MALKYSDYDEIKPEFKYLSDKAVMIQAWKKAHQYIRNHNWFADSLELDLSCLNLDKYCANWCTVFNESNYTAYIPDPMRLVPAPKSCEWTLQEDKWEPSCEADFSLRPLAHLSIKDQTLGMLFLICLANIVESEQGPIELVEGAAADELPIGVSYGNRLLCKWVYDPDDKYLPDANFQWANVEVYKRYYTDFKAFVERPKKVIDKYSSQISDKENIAIISLDLSKCFDRIKRDILKDKVTNLINTWADHIDHQFLDCFEQFLKWEWHENDKNLAEQYQKQLNPQESDSRDWLNGVSGIPQGLVISGFLANIYLLEFDSHIKNIVEGLNTNNLSESLNKVNAKIIDYSRYVDDIRLVIAVDEGIKKESLQEEVGKCVKDWLDKYAEGQIINEKKTSVNFATFENRTNLIEEYLNEIKSRSSGPVDEMSGMEILSLTQHVWEDSFSDDKIQTDSDSHIKSLLEPNKQVAVKKDTMERFAAYSWRRIYRHLTSLIPPESEKRNEFIDLYTTPCSRSKLDILAGLFCREVVIRWFKDPSKVRILRISFDLFPQVDLLKIVLEKLLETFDTEQLNSPKYQMSVYALAELYRAAAIETGFVYDQEHLPRKSDIKGYRELLLEKAKKLLSNRQEIPWYLANQLILFSVVISSDKNLNEAQRLKAIADRKYKRLYELVHSRKGYRNYSNTDSDLLLLAYKFSRSEPFLKTHFARMISSAAKPKVVLRKWIKTVPKSDRLLKSLLPEDTAVSLKKIITCFGASKKKSVSAITDEKWTTIARIIKSPESIFMNEVAVLKLAMGLCKAINDGAIRSSKSKFLTPTNLEIKILSRKNLGDPCYETTMEIKQKDSYKSRLYKPEPWESGDRGILSQIGRILRAVAVDNIDFTLMKNHFGKNEKAQNVGPHKYWGVRTSWLKRKYGLYFDRSAAGGEHLAFSPWFMELLSSLLAFPGSLVDDKFKELSFKKFETKVFSRLEELKNYHGKASNTPIYPVSVDLDKVVNGKSSPSTNELTVAIVQTMFPSLSVIEKDLKVNGTENKRTHRRHIADMLQLLLKNFKTHKLLDSKLSGVNLVIFPELAIHKDQLFELERFADKMNCLVFCGLVFIENPENTKETINGGMWLIPQNGNESENRSFIKLFQGKKHMTSFEMDNSITSYRPVQWLINGITVDEDKENHHWTLSSSICYDATDIKLAADLRDFVDCHIVSAFNKDIEIFDNMAEALRYHMFNHTVIVNAGEFGGSTIQAPYKKNYERVLLHSHGQKQATVTIRKLELKHFTKGGDNTKSPPAGYEGRKLLQ